MTSAPLRDPVADHFLTPQNAALLLIDNSPHSWPGSARWIVGAVVGGALLRPGPLGQKRTPPPAQGGITTAQAEASRERAQ
jgi:hypothetical protein